MVSPGTALKGMPSAEQNAFLLIVTSGYMLSAEIVLDLTSNHFFYCTLTISCGARQLMRR